MVQHSAIDHTGITGVGGALTVEDEGTPLATGATTLDFVGAGVTASGTGAEKTITIPGTATPPDCDENYITSNVTIVNADTWYAGPTLTTPPAGTYLCIGKLMATSTFNGVTSCSAGIGKTSPPTEGNGQQYVPVQNAVVTITVTAIITVNGSENIVLYGLSARGSSVASILDTASSGGIADKGSSLVAVRITAI